MQWLKEKAILGLIVTLFLIFAACGNDSHENMHGRTMRGGQMKNGGMMRGGQNMMRDSGASRQGGMMGGAQGGQQPVTSNFPQNIEEEKAYELAQEYLQSTGNTAYEIGKSSEQDGEFEFPLIRKSDGNRVASLFVDKQTGKVRSAQ